MSQIIASPEMARQIEAATGGVAIVNEQGTTIALCLPLKPKPSAHSPEEIGRRRKDLERVRREYREHPERGKTLAEVMAHLQQLAGGSP